MQIPFYTGHWQNQRLQNKLVSRLCQVIDSGTYILGKEVAEFERRVSEFCGVKHAIGVANGSDALFLAVQALHLQEGSEVITTPFTFFASTACITRSGLKPVFVDIDPDTYNINPVLVERAVTPKTKALLPVDLFSQMADYDSLLKIAKRHKLKVIEDSAESFGMSYQGINAGCAGDIGVFSFFPTKTIGCFGDGGMVTTNDDDLADYVRKCRVHGAAKKYHHQYVGINSRLDEMQAAILNLKMDGIKEDIAERAKIVSWYQNRLEGVDQIKLPKILSGAQAVWYVFSIQCERRDELQKYLTEQGIGTSIYYPIPMHLQECFSDLGYKKGDFPVAEQLCAKALALPVFIGMKEDQVDYVSTQIKKFYKKQVTSP